MTNIINLIKADFFKIMSISLLYKLLLLVTVILAFSAPQTSPFLLILLIYVMGFGLISYDENYHTQNYYAFLPIRRSEYVIGKFAFSLIFLLGSTVLCCLCTFLGLLMGIDSIFTNQLSSPLPLYILTFIIALVYLSVQYPLALFLGGMKGRVVAMIFYFALFSFFFNGNALYLALSFIQNSSLFLLLVIALAIYGISCMITIRLYEKRDLK